MRLRLAMVSPFPEMPNMIRGGVEAVTYSLTAGLRAITDIEIHIIAPCYGRLAGVELRDGMTLHWLRSSRLPGVISYWSSFRHSIHRCLGEIRPDVTHFQGVGGWTLGYESPYVFTIHGIAERDVLFTGGHLLYLRKNVIAFVERQARKRSPHTILINPYVFEEIGDQIHGRQWHIENPVLSEFFNVTPLSNQRRILYVGRISERKNVEGLLKAFARLREVLPTASLRIAGAPDDPRYLEKCLGFVQANRLESAVHFLGNVDRAKLLEELSHAACLALVSKQETAPMIVEEAMAAGVPVVASRICGLPYMIKDGKTGFLVNADDEHQIVQGLLSVLGNSEIAAKLSSEAREIALQRFHSHVVAEKTLAVYMAAMDNRGAKKTRARS